MVQTSIIKISLLFICILSSSMLLFSQESDFSSKSLKTGVGIGLNDSEQETGVGTLLSFGYQKTMWNDRLRINPNFTTGTFSHFVITDIRDQYYKITSLAINGYLDALKLKLISIFIGTGIFLNYSRGLLGTGGWHQENQQSEFFHKLYYGAGIAAGLRVNNEKSRFAYEVAPINAQLGNNSFSLGYLMFGLDIKLKKR